MLQRTLLAPTLREVPAEAEAASHRLMLKGGFIRQLAAGVYTYLPLGWRVLHKVQQIIRQELGAAGAQEVLLPALQPASLWEESGRYATYGGDLMRLADRHDRDFVLGPTHEEVITALVRDEIQGYRKLPLTLYQIQTKFRDERRPRSGLLRGREFLMMDAYSFDIDEEGLAHSYAQIMDAYVHIFARCGLQVQPVEADSGAIGGSGGSHEFMVLADAGEDTVVTCTQCSYAANLELAPAQNVAPGTADSRNVAPGAADTRNAAPGTAYSRNVAPSTAVNVAHGSADGRGDHDAAPVPAGAQTQAPIPASIQTPVQASIQAPIQTSIPAPERLYTPGIQTIEQLTAALQADAEQLIKTMVFNVDGSLVAVLARGDQQVNEVKVRRYLQAEQVEIADVVKATRAAGLVVGFLGPVGLPKGMPVLVDGLVAAMEWGIAGANEQDYHLRYLRPGRDFSLEHVGDFCNAVEGTECPACAVGELKFARGIEVGHVFKLGTKYSSKLKATIVNAQGKEQPVIMGCYGIGVSRMLAAIAEQCRDEDGIIWPMAIAPFQVHILPVSTKDRDQMGVAVQLYDDLRCQGVEVLLDDRDERPGVKFKDADLFGIPIQIIVGKLSSEGKVEYRLRQARDKEVLPVGDAIRRVVEDIAGLGGALRG